MKKETKETKNLDVGVLYEPNRLETKFLADAYQQVVPISKRRLSLLNTINPLEIDKRKAGGALC